MAQYIIVPADIEPTVVCCLGASVDWLLLPPEATRKIEVDGQAIREEYSPRIEFLNQLTDQDEIYAPQGGEGDAFLVGAFQRDVKIYRMTFLDINKLKESVMIPKDLSMKTKKVKEDSEATELERKETSRQVERINKVSVMASLVRVGDISYFHPYKVVDMRTSLIRVYISQLLAMQDEVRKRLQQRTRRLDRDQGYFLDPSVGSIALDHRIKLVKSKESVDSLLEFENDLEKQIVRQLKHLPVWTEVLEPVIGIGPRLAARMISQIIDINHFPKLSGFTKYGGWHVMQNGRPRAASFIRGESAQFNQLLRMGYWLFGGQIVRNNSQFRWYYDKYKAERQALLGTVICQDKKGKDLKMSKAWLEARARRYAVSKFIKYLWFGWWELHGKRFTSKVTGKEFRARDLLAPERFYLTS